MEFTTVLLQKVATVEGKGLDSPEPLDLTYIVPQNRTAGVRYVHAGNASAGMVNVTLLRNGLPMRHVPVPAGGAVHVNLAVVDDLRPGTGIEVVAAGEGTGTLILDVGITEAPEEG